MKYRRFTQDLKRFLIEQLLSEAATPPELCRRYNISSDQLYTWKRQCAQGKLDPEPSKEAERKEGSLLNIAPLSKAFKAV